MIVVLGSRHDAVAAELVAAWPGAALCSAEDLVSPGWAWHFDRQERTWVVGGCRVPDEAVTGVFLRRSNVYADELGSIHPEDRAYLAAESLAFLTFVLATTSARVVNPVIDGAIGEEVFRPDRIAALAPEHGIVMRPVRVTTEARQRPLRVVRSVEVAGEEACGEGVPARLTEASVRLCRALGVQWATLLFDGRNRLLAVTGARRPSPAAVEALCRLLSARP